MKLTAEELEKARKTNRCAICGGALTYYATWENPREKRLGCMADPKHQGIAREYRPFEPTEIEWRREMTQEHGAQKTAALAKYQGQASLTVAQATEIIDVLWPEASKASPAEVYKAKQVCVQYGLNPLMQHVFLIPFNKREKRNGEWITVGTTYATVLGIKATRLIASRKHSFSYIDNTPRLMTAAEQEQVFGEVDTVNLRAICILQDTQTGATVRGYGSWPKATEPKGMDKGNSKANMAFIRAERQAMDRMAPADLPGPDIPVIDEQYEVPATTVTVEGVGRVEQATGEIVEGAASDPDASAPAVEQAAPTTAEEDFDAMPSASQPAPAKPEPPTFKTAGDVLTWCLSHGKQYDKKWVFSGRFTINEERLKTKPEECAAEIAKLMNWT